MLLKAVTLYLRDLSVSTVICLWNVAVYQDTSENWPHGQFSEVSW